MDIIPAIDLLDGRCVRLYQGDYHQSQVYSENPVKIARQWADLGATCLHLVDLDGAKQGKLVNLTTIEAIVKSIAIPVQVGGGLRNSLSIAQLLNLI
jgi:phosphoribosylformimino-5-aminoimidazole carboxamide ribotide isomerase